MLAGTSFNRILHKEEEAAIAELLADGYDKSAIDAVACYEVKCWRGDPSLGVMNIEVERQVMAAIEAMGPQQQATLLDALKSKAPGQFIYKASDYLSDGWKDNDIGGKLSWLGNTTLDLAPVIGDAKAYYEAETANDYYWATVGLVPFGGDVAKKIAKNPEVQQASRQISPVAPAKRSTGETILGHYPEYVSVSEIAGARRFEIPEAAWNNMNEVERWEANRKFLDRTAERGDSIGLATPATAARPGSYYARELEYMKNLGYTLSLDGTKLFPLGKSRK